MKFFDFPMNKCFYVSGYQGRMINDLTLQSRAWRVAYMDIMFTSRSGPLVIEEMLELEEKNSHHMHLSVKATEPILSRLHL